MSRRQRPLRLALAASLLASAAAAQISPGPLSAAHASLEGSQHCFSCHRAGEGVVASLCFDCHRALGARVETGRGLHASAEHRACERCHSEHNGREFALVHFDGGRERFDHAAAGWTLRGRHARLGCAECHRAERVDRALLRLESTLDPAATHLGLSPDCASCHADPHGGTLAAPSCATCHGEETWKEAAGFDHERTRYPLDGAHARVACAECHELPAGAEASARPFSQFGGKPLPGCAGCHEDPHRGRLGPACSDCHSTSSFRARTDRRFDHERTRYPLVGRHVAVDCAKCHPSGQELRVPGYDRCETCHRDVHAGQLRTAVGGGACSDCHGVDGFRPAHYAIESHARASFALAGAHRAVPCPACHRPVAARALPEPFGRAARGETMQFRFPDTACAACHRDPHEGRLDRYAGDRGCAACHGVDGWRAARFDHDRSGYPLAGRHADVACDRCHAPDAEGRKRLSGLPTDCASCHRDVHAGQLARGGVTACERCHSVAGFRPTAGFDHAVDTRWALDGAHQRVACAACHRSEPSAEGAVVRYRPLPLDCVGCHAPGDAATAPAHRPRGGAR
ncbi:MAG: hypothetical protein KDB94_00815 [Acidobacteria bacterium]|nr:hypothetical protein [Acidobacteriota bacterium]